MAKNNMSQVFGDLLARVGVTWIPAKLDRPTEAELSRRRAQVSAKADLAPRRRALGRFYLFDGHGTLRRIQGNRDRSVSARQWKKRNKAAKRLAQSERRLIDAVAAALPVLISDRDAAIQSNTVAKEDGTPDLATLDEDAKPYVAEYNRVIALCEDALRKAGLR